jgi:hypothetical protein
MYRAYPEKDGARLRKLVKEKVPSLSLKQTATRRNFNNVEVMKRAVWAVFFTCG